MSYTQDIYLIYLLGWLIYFYIIYTSLFKVISKQAYDVYKNDLAKLYEARAVYSYIKVSLSMGELQEWIVIGLLAGVSALLWPILLLINTKQLIIKLIRLVLPYIIWCATRILIVVFRLNIK